MLVPLSIDEHYLKEDLVPEELDGIKVLVRMNTHSWSGFSIISLGVSSDTPKPDWGLYDYLLIHLAAEDSDWDSQILELKRKLINLHELYLLVAQKVVRISEKNEFFPQSWQIYFDSKGVNIFAGQFSSIIKTDIEPCMQKITPAQFELTKIVGQIRTILELVSRRRSFKGKCPACS